MSVASLVRAYSSQLPNSLFLYTASLLRRHCDERSVGFLRWSEVTISVFLCNGLFFGLFNGTRSICPLYPFLHSCAKRGFIGSDFSLSFRLVQKSQHILRLSQRVDSHTRQAKE